MVPGLVPKELADLTNLTVLYLHGNKDLEVPDGAPVSGNDDFAYYEGREKVAAFQACLK